METLLQAIYNELKYLKKVSNQTDFGKKLGYEKAYISTLMKQAGVTNAVSKRLISVFGISEAWLRSYTPESDLKKMFDPVMPAEQGKKRIPVIGEGLAGTDMEINVHDKPEEDYIDVGDLLSRFIAEALGVDPRTAKRYITITKQTMHSEQARIGGF